MAAPEGNQYYLNVIRKTGRPAIFKSPEELVKKFNEYLEIAKDKVIYKADFIKSGQNAGDIIQVPYRVPLTIEGFINYIGVTYKTFREWENNENFKEFVTIVTHIKNVIRQDQIEGGLVGTLNPMLVARIQGLKEQTEHSGEVKQTVTNIEFIQRNIQDAEFTEVKNEIDNF